MKGLIFEQLNPTDHAALSSFLTRVQAEFTPPLSEIVGIETYADKLLHHAYAFVAVLDRHWQGFSAVYVNDSSERKRAFLSSIVVLPESRGQGIGTALLERVVKIARDHQMKELVLEVSGRSGSALRLYSAFGFEPADLAIPRTCPDSIFLKKIISH